MLSELFMLMDSGKYEEAQALTVQCMKASHQAMLDEGSWKLAWHLTTLRDPLSRQQFGGTERELEAIASYSRALEELEVRLKKERQREAEPEGDDGHTGERKDRKGRGRGGKGAEAVPK